MRLRFTFYTHSDNPFKLSHTHTHTPEFSLPTPYPLPPTTNSHYLIPSAPLPPPIRHPQFSGPDFYTEVSNRITLVLFAMSETPPRVTISNSSPPTSPMSLEVPVLLPPFWPPRTTLVSEAQVLLLCTKEPEATLRPEQRPKSRPRKPAHSLGAVTRPEASRVWLRAGYEETRRISNGLSTTFPAPNYISQRARRCEVSFLAD